MNDIDRKFSWPLYSLPRITLCGRFFHKADNFTVKYLCDINALHIYEYEGLIRIGNELINFKPGDITITPIGKVSTYKFSRSGLHHCVHFEPGDDIPDNKDTFSLNMHIPATEITPPAGERIKKAISIFNRPADERNKKINSSIASAMLLESLLTLRTADPVASGNEKDKIAHLAALIDSTLSENPPIPELAAGVGLSQNYLAAIFKNRMGKTIKQYILERKMARSKYLLRSTRMQVKAIAREVGIDDQQYFNRKFTQSQGLTPLEYRRSKSF